MNREGEDRSAPAIQDRINHMGGVYTLSAHHQVERDRSRERDGIEGMEDGMKGGTTGFGMTLNASRGFSFGQDWLCG